jgi:hypothetical protein
MPSALDRMPLTVTGYRCVICRQWHRAGSKPFKAHWSAHFDKDNRYIAVDWQSKDVEKREEEET